MPHAVVVALAAVNNNRYLLVLSIALSIITALATQSADNTLIALTSLIGFVATFLISVVINARIMQLIYQGSTHESASELIQQYTFRAFVVSLLLGLIAIGLGVLLHFTPPGLLTALVIKPAVLTLWDMITAYVLPIVFIKNLSLTTISTGVLYFFYAGKAGKPLIYSFVLVFLVGLALKYTYINFGSGFLGAGVLPYIAAIAGMAFGLYFQFFIFALATIIIKTSHTTPSTDDNIS